MTPKRARVIAVIMSIGKPATDEEIYQELVKKSSDILRVEFWSLLKEVQDDGFVSFNKLTKKYEARIK